MAAEDLTTYTEVDTVNDRLTVIATRCTFTALGQAEEIYCYKDKGAAHFSGDFEHLIDTLLDDADTDPNSQGQIWELANDIDDGFGRFSASKDFLAVFWYDDAGAGYPCLYARECNGGGLTQDSSIELNYDQVYYLKIKRDEAVGANGTLYLYIYDADTREPGDLLDTLTVTLTEKQDFQYIYCNSAWKDGDPDWQTGYCENLNLQEIVGYLGSRGFIIG